MGFNNLIVLFYRLLQEEGVAVIKTMTGDYLITNIFMFIYVYVYFRRINTVSAEYSYKKEYLKDER